VNKVISLQKLGECSSKEDKPINIHLLLVQRKRDTGISYCRLMLHDTMLNKDIHSQVIRINKNKLICRSHTSICIVL